MDKSISCSLAQTSLIYIMNDNKEFSRFVNITGIEADHIREQINDEYFLRGILEYILNWEPLLNAIALENDVSSVDFKKAHRSLMDGVMEYQSI